MTEAAPVTFELQAVVTDSSQIACSVNSVDETSAPAATNGVAAADEQAPNLSPAHLRPANVHVATASPPTGSNSEAAANNQNAEDKASFGDLYFFATTGEKFAMVLSSLLSAGQGCAMTLSMIIFGDVLDGVNDPAKLLDSTRKAALNFLIIALVTGFAAAVGSGLPILAAERQMKRAREAYFAAVLRQDSEWFDTVKSGEMASNLAENSLTWKSGIAEKLPQAFNGLAMMCTGLTLGFYYSWQLTLLIMSIAPGLAILGGAIKFASGKLEKEASDAMSEAGAFATEALNSIRVIVAYCGQNREVRKYEALIKKVQRAYVRKSLWVAASIGSMLLMVFTAYAYSMYVGGVLVRRDLLTGGRVVQTFFVVMQAIFSLGSTVPGLVAIASAQIAAAKMLKVIRRVPVVDVADPGGIKTDILGHIEFRDVCFAYPARLNVPILKNFNLIIERGQSVAFVGPSGSGKSTIIALVLRMYNPQSGCIYIDGKDIKDYNVVHLRNALGLVSQDPQLFSLSVSQNIALGKKNQVASQEEIVDAARAANAHSFICSLPEGYDTIVGTSVNSSQISGGQRQRICIARCLIRKPSIMLFDEATSALDIESEVAVQNSIDELLSTSARPTSLVIAHRLSTIVNADRICVVEHGSVVQSGSHNELMREEAGLYHHLQTLQRLDVLPETEPSVDTPTDVLPSPPVLAPHRTSDPPIRRVSGAKVQSAAQPSVSSGIEERPDIPESRVWAMQAPEMRYIIPGLLFSLANGGVSTIVGFVLARAVAAFYLPGNEMEAALLNVVGYFMAIAIGLFLLTLFNNWFFSIAGEALSARLRCMAFAHILKMEIGFFDEKGHSAGALEARLSADAGLVKGATGQALSQLVSSAGALVVGIVVAMQATWRIGLIVLAAFPLQIVSGAYMMRAFDSDNKMDKEALEKSGHVASEAAIAIRTVSSLNLQGWMCNKFAADTAARFEAAKSGAVKYSARFGFGFLGIRV